VENRNDWQAINGRQSQERENLSAVKETDKSNRIAGFVEREFDQKPTSPHKVG